MAITADSVVVELEAKVAGYNAAIADAAGKTDAAMGRIGKAANDAEKQFGKSAGQIANAQRNLGRQFADVGASLSSGASPFVILGQQSAQVADALADTGGRAAKVAQFFAGPWGAALLAAGSVLAVFAEKAFKAGDSVEDLVEKLQASDDKARRGALAQDIFSISLQGAAKSSAELSSKLQQQNQSQIQVAQSALAAAEAQRQLTIQNLKQEASRAAIAAANAKAFRIAPALGPGGVEASGPAILAAREKEIEANKRVAVANRAVADAERARVEARIPLLKLDAAAASDKSAAAIQRQERAVNKLTEEYRQASGAAQLLSGKAREAAQQAADRRYTQGVANANRTLTAEQDAIRESEKKGPNGPSAATLAKRTEVNRVRGVRVNEDFNNELERLNGQIAASKREQAVNAEEVAAAERERIDAELKRRIDGINADESARKYTALQAEQLRLLANQVAGMQRISVDTQLRERLTQEQLMMSGSAIRSESELLRLQSSLTDSRDRRKQIDLRLIDLAYQQERAELEAVATSQTATDAQRKIAEARLKALGGLQQAEQAGVDRRYEGQYSQYRREIDSADGLAESIDRIKIGTLESVTDELTNATKAALGLKGAFGDIVGELIRIGIQRRLIGPLADALFGGAGGGGSGGFLGSLIGSIAGRASGGNVMAGKIYKINESGPELFQPSQSGKIYPTGQLNKAAGRGAGPTIIQQSFTLDARYGITTPQLLDYVNRTATQKATQAGRAAYEASPARSAKLSSLGT